jgi:NAD-dependent dihydropyrimidine dehydrogenase PreA subunit
MADLRDIENRVRDAGLEPRGAFHPGPEDGVPPLPDGGSVGTVVLVGNVGPSMWEAFSSAGDPSVDTLDDWSERVLTGIARHFRATACFPFSLPPLPFQRWAMRAEPCHVSPLGILVHPDHGLWHGYRGALLLGKRLALPPVDPRPSPCDGCADKPCLDTCPVGAFSASGYDVPACTRHMATPAGEDCLDRGCRARRACPVGETHRYGPAQASFHMTHFLRCHGPGADT